MKTLSLIAVAISSILAAQAYAVDAPQKLDCMVAQAKTGSWNESIVLTNQCGRTIEMQNSLLQFQTNQNLRGGFWGQLSPLAWPAQTELSSQQIAGGYLTSIPLKFPVGNQWWKPNSKLPAGKSITLTFSGNPQTTINDIAFYPVAPPPPAQKGQLILKLPANPAGDSAVKPDIVVSGGNGYQMNITDAKWQQDFVLPDVPYGQYTITVKSLEHNDQMWTGKGVPQSLFLNQTEGTIVNVQYELVPAKGGIALQIAQAMPEANLAQPVVHVRDLNTGQDINQVALNWNQTQVVSGLLANQNYELRADNIAGKWHEYHPTFLDGNPVNVKANQNVQARIQYQAIPIVSTLVKANVSGLPDGKNGEITVVDNLGHQFSQTLTNGQKELWNLPANRQYNVSVVSFQHDGVTYRAKVTPSNFMLEKNKPITLNIAYQASNDDADFVAYWAGWSNYQLNDLAQTKVDVVNLSFANILADGVGYKVDTSVSGYLRAC